MDDHGVQCVTAGEVFFEGLSNVRDVGIGGGEPVHNFLVASDIGNLRWQYVRAQHVKSLKKA